MCLRKFVTLHFWWRRSDKLKTLYTIPVNTSVFNSPSLTPTHIPSVHSWLTSSLFSWTLLHMYKKYNEKRAHTELSEVIQHLSVCFWEVFLGFFGHHKNDLSSMHTSKSFWLSRRFQFMFSKYATYRARGFEVLCFGGLMSTFSFLGGFLRAYLIKVLATSHMAVSSGHTFWWMDPLYCPRVQKLYQTITWANRGALPSIFRKP